MEISLRFRAFLNTEISWALRNSWINWDSVSAGFAHPCGSLQGAGLSRVVCKVDTHAHTHTHAPWWIRVTLVLCKTQLPTENFRAWGQPALMFTCAKADHCVCVLQTGGCGTLWVIWRECVLFWWDVLGQRRSRGDSNSTVMVYQSSHITRTLVLQSCAVCAAFVVRVCWGATTCPSVSSSQPVSLGPEGKSQL